MKRLILLFLATAAILSACCGVFYVQKTQSADVVYQEEQESVGYPLNFSLKNAKFFLRFSTFAGYPEALSGALEKKGFVDVEYFQYEKAGKNDNKAGLALSHKGNRIIAVVRGTESEEWYSNFFIGEGSHHAGFASASELVTENINSYMEKHKLSKSESRIYFTGHSRGAAVANLTAASLIDEGDFEYVCAYTFACPNTTTDVNATDGKYNSIINITNPEDFICYIPLPQWGYGKYGQTLYLPSEDTTENYGYLYTEMEKEYLKDTKTAHKGFPNGSKDVEEVVEFLYSVAPTPDDYYNKEIYVEGYSMTMYDFMMKLADVMNGENTLSHGMFMMFCKSIPQVAPITEFMFSGMTAAEVKELSSLSSTPVVINHMQEVYSAWFKVLSDEYFEEQIV